VRETKLQLTLAFVKHITNSLHHV